MTDSDEDTGLSKLAPREAFAACLRALRAGDTLPDILREEYGEHAYQRAKRALASAPVALIDREGEIVEALTNEMHGAVKGATRVAAGSALLRASTTLKVKKMEAEQRLSRDPASRAEAVKELRELDDPLFELIVDVWITDDPPPRAIELISLLIESPNWAKVLVAAGWSKT
jgi:hypothetical protein